MVRDARERETREQFDLSPDFQFNGRAYFYGDGTIQGGADSYVGDGTTILAVAGHRVTIGEGCAISHAVRIYTESRDADHDMRSDKRVSGDVIIGNYVWIGAGVFINPAVTIGDHAVVGANAVVTRDVEPWTIVGGVPARIIRRKRHAPDQE